MSYYGVSKNIQVISIHSDLLGGEFFINYTYGSESDVHTGHYSVEGKTINASKPVAIYGEGTFVQMNHRQEPALPREEVAFGWLYIEDGYLNFAYMGTTHKVSGFETLILDNLTAGDYEQDVIELMLEGITPWTAGRELFDYLRDYLRELLRATPIEEIVGPLPPELRKALGKQVGQKTRAVHSGEESRIVVG